MKERYLVRYWNDNGQEVFLLFDEKPFALAAVQDTTWDIFTLKEGLNCLEGRGEAIVNWEE